MLGKNKPTALGKRILCRGMVTVKLENVKPESIEKHWAANSNVVKGFGTWGEVSP